MNHIHWHDLLPYSHICLKMRKNSYHKRSTSKEPDGKATGLMDSSEIMKVKFTL